LPGFQRISDVADFGENRIATFWPRSHVWPFEFHVVGDNPRTTDFSQNHSKDKLVKMRIGLLIMLTVMVSACGCKPEDAITVHKIPKSASGLDGIRESASKNSAAPFAGGRASAAKEKSSRSAVRPTRLVLSKINGKSSSTT